MKNENSTARGERIRAERIEEDKRVAEAAATEAAKRTEKDRIAAEEKAREEADAMAASKAEEAAGQTFTFRSPLQDAIERNAPAGSEQAERLARVEADRADRAERDRQHVDRVASGGGVTRVDKGVSLTLWELHAKNREAPPFHFTGVAHRIVVAAKSAEDARHIAAGAAGDHGVAWLDDTQTDCAELKPTERGVVAQDLGA